MSDATYSLVAEQKVALDHVIVSGNIVKDT